MPSEPGKPVIFISYSHKDEPDPPGDGKSAGAPMSRIFCGQ